MSLKVSAPAGRAVIAVSPEATARLNRILDEATRLFDQQGFMRTTTEDVAAAADVTKRTLYRYVSSKESLLLLIHERFLDRHDTASEDSRDQNVEDRFRAFVRNYVAVIVEYQASVRVFFEEMKHLSAADREAVMERRDSFEESLRSILREGIADGTFADVDVEVVSMMVFGALSGIYKWHSPEGPLGQDELGELLANLLLNGLLGGGNTGASAGPTVQIQPRPRHEDGQRSRKPIRRDMLDAATLLFAERGYDATTTRELADACKVTKSALYYHIGTKEDLLFDIQDRFALESIARLLEVLADMPDEPAEDVFNTVMRTHCSTMDTDRAGVAVFSEQMRYLLPEHLERVQRLSNEYVALIGDVVRATATNEQLHAHPSPVTLAIVGAANSMHRWYKPNGRLTITEIADILSRLFLEGLSLAPRAGH